MDYIELTAAVAPADAERAADILRAETGAGVAIDLPFVQHSLELGAEMRADAHAFVRVYVKSAPAISSLSVTLANAGIDADLQQRTVADEDWAEAWKDHFHVERFGRIVVVPSWRTDEPHPGDVVLTLDPGMAFGTGQHETTRMCLEALDRHVRPGIRMLDVGCGSGILAIAVAKLGAAHVRAVDIDPDCVRITRDNAAANGVGAIVCAGVVADDGPVFGDAIESKFEVITANIIASTIGRLAPALSAALAHGGRLIASGVIAERARETCDAIEAAGLHVDAVRATGEWRCIEAVPAGAAPD